jgi:hypothetical protein
MLGDVGDIGSQSDLSKSIVDMLLPFSRSKPFSALLLVREMASHIGQG